MQAPQILAYLFFPAYLVPKYLDTLKLDGIAYKCVTAVKED